MEEYTNRELGLKLEALSKEIKEGFKGVHDRQDTTNGKVKKNCGEIESIKSWRWFITGGLAVVTTLILPILLMVLRNHI